MRSPRAAALTVLALLATAAPASAQTAPGPPPFAFRTATLVRPDHAIEVRLSAVADVAVTVVITRGTVRLGHAAAQLGRGDTIVPIPIGPRGIRKLREGLHVKVAIFYGASEPVRAEPALLLGDGADAHRA